MKIKKRLSAWLLTILIIFTLSISQAWAATLMMYPKFKGLDSSGSPLVGGLLYTYEPGTTTEKATYTDRTASTPNANPVVLDSNGEATVYGTGSYKFVLKTSAGVTVWTMDNLRGINQTVLTTTGDYDDDFDAAITAIGATPTTLYVNSTATLSTGVTVPSTCTVIVLAGGTIDLNGSALTMNGPLYFQGGTLVNDAVLTINNAFHVTGIYQVFTDTTSPVFGQYVEESRPEWFGSIDGTDDDVQIQAAIDAYPAANAGIIKFLSDNYIIDSKVTVSQRKDLVGIGTTYNSGGTRFTSNVAADACIQIGDGTTASSGSLIKNIRVDAGTGTDGIGIYIYYGNRNHLENVFVDGFTTGTGIKINGDSGGSGASIQNVLKDVYLANNLTNLLLTGTDVDEDSSSDEGMFSNIRINLSALANSKGIHIFKGFGNSFRRVTILDSALTSGTIGIHFDDGSRTNVYSAIANSFYDVFMEDITTAVKSDANSHDNLIMNLHLHDPSIVHNDSSGGGNIIKFSSETLNTTYQPGTNVNQTHQNLLYNSEFERWEASTSAAPTGWTLSGAGASVSRDSSNERKGTYSAAVTRSGADTILYQSKSDYTYLQGRWVTAGVWVKASVANRANIKIYDGVDSSNSLFHTGGGSYEFLVVRHLVNAAATELSLYLQITTGDTTVYFDQAILIEGVECPLPYDKPLMDAKRLYATTTWDPANLADGAGETKSLTVNGAAFGDFVIVAAPYDLQDMTVTGYVQAADTVEIRLQNESGGAIDLASGSWAVMIFKY